ncbi:MULTISPECIES: motility associated factor glycosyltransferase family protein [Clostridium]|uniref:motility associated factor glycosyltransferase family protein n=1 Tax=Clostridium TaxID=1485 RepID=UPI0004D59F48|nr:MULTISPECIES: 6-hydroxymethylpterin diphosphokinase MptE-like protein [Clostridium]KEH88689.1 hypothetical protein Z967_01330 [Clostridium novyi A str. 4540]KEH94311.1 hypothetical protein Z963_10085 [Clostridium botulinum C/D str. It1]KEH95009.1 hypothetical protein Z964_10210 [Clostridium novyi A str. GD211209]
MIKVEEIRNGVYTIKYNNKYIHSRYNPIKECTVLINKYEYLIQDSVVIVYGLGLGYHVEEILRRNPMIKIYVFEGSNEIIKVCKTINSKIFDTKNVKIISSSQENFYDLFIKKLNGVQDIIIHKPSLEIIKDSNFKLYSVINNYIISKQSVDQSGLLEENYIQNLNINYKNIKYLINKFLNKNKKFVITAAGPSLDYELELLKKNKEEFILVSVGAALRTLNQNNIKPDIIVIIDASPLIENQLKGFEDEQIPLCFLSTASRWAVKNYNGPKYMFFNSKDEDNIVIETGNTVAVAAMSIALHCGAQEIVMIGQDLAYLNGKSHTNTYEEIYGHKDEPIINKNNKLVKSVDGTMIETTKGYIYFKEQIERLIELNKNVKFINCSKGAFINGAKHMEFKDYIKNDKNC